MDVSAKFDTRMIGFAMGQLWTVDSTERDRLVTAVDTRGLPAECPITLEPPLIPVMLGDGKVYEQDQIAWWFQNNDRAPCTNLTLPHKTLLKMAPLREAV